MLGPTLLLHNTAYLTNHQGFFTFDYRFMILMTISCPWWHTFTFLTTFQTLIGTRLVLHANEYISNMNADFNFGTVCVLMRKTVGSLWPPCLHCEGHPGRHYPTRRLRQPHHCRRYQFHRHRHGVQRVHPRVWRPMGGAVLDSGHGLRRVAHHWMHVHLSAAHPRRERGSALGRTRYKKSKKLAVFFVGSFLYL